MFNNHKIVLSIFAAISCLALISATSFSSSSDYELSVTWKLKYGILLQDGSTRGERPEGYISEMIEREGETQLVLRNFYCTKAIQQVVCPVVFYDKKGKVVGYEVFKKQDGPSDYVVKVPSNCAKYQLSTENINSLNPTASCNRDSKQAAAKNATKRAQYSSAIDKDVTTVKNKIKKRSVIYSMPVFSKPDLSVTLRPSDGSLSDLMKQCESKYKNKVIAINIEGDYNVNKTEVLSVNKNKYIITCSGVVSGLSKVSGYKVKGDVLSFNRPKGLNSIESILINGEEYSVCGDYDQNNPDQMPSFKDVKITEVSTSNGRYVYRIPLKDVSHFVKGSYIKIYSEWICQMAEVVSVGKKSIDVASHTAFGQTLMKSTYPVNLYCVRNNSKYIKPGTFWYDGTTVYCKLKNRNTKVSSVEVPTEDILFSVQNASGVIFKGIHFNYTAASDIFTYYEQGAIDCDGCVSVVSSRNIHFLDCEFDHIGNNCISIRRNSSECSVQGSYFHDLGSGAIAVNNSKMPWQSGYKEDATQSILIYSNIVRGYGNINAGSAGILVGYGNQISIISNHVFDGYYTGISVGWGWNQYKLNKNTYVAGNVVHHIMKFLLCDGGGIYTLSNWEGGSIEGNTIYCVNSRSRRDCAFGIYHDEGSAEILDYNNLVYACDLGNGSCYSSGVIENNIYAYIGDYVFQVREGSNGLTSYATKNLVSTLGTKVYSTSFGVLENEPMTRIQKNVRFDIGGNRATVSDTYNSYDWKVSDVTFADPKKGNFNVKNQNAIRSLIGFNFDRTKDYNGHVIPPFQSSFSSYCELDSEYLQQYNALYRAMSLNKDNPFFSE